MKACPRPWTGGWRRAPLNHWPGAANPAKTSPARSGPCADGAIPTMLQGRRPSRMLVTEKVFGFLLAALGVQLVLNGLSDVGVIHLTTGH